MSRTRDLKKMALSALKIFAVPAPTVVLMIVMYAITAPLIRGRIRSDEESVLRSLVNEGEPGRRCVAFPLELTEGRFQMDIGARSLDERTRSAIRGRYQAEKDGRLHLKNGLTEGERTELSRLLESVRYKNPGPVRAYYPVRNGATLEGYIIELSAPGFGGEIRALAFYAPDGTLRRTLVRGHDERTAQAKKILAEKSLTSWAGKKGKDVPVVKRMLTLAEADAVSGATVTFMALGRALRDGSSFVAGVEEK